MKAMKVDDIGIEMKCPGAYGIGIEQFSCYYKQGRGIVTRVPSITKNGTLFVHNDFTNILPIWSILMLQQLFILIYGQFKTT